MARCVMIPAKFTRASGGLSSLLDLGKVLQQIGFNVLYYSSDYVTLLWFFRVFLPRGSHGIAYRQIVRIAPGVSRRPMRSRLKVGPRATESIEAKDRILPKPARSHLARQLLKSIAAVAWDPIEIVLGATRSDRKKIWNADVIVVNDLWPGIAPELRRQSRAKLIFNHAGSADTFINFFLPAASPEKHKDAEENSIYADFLRTFDSVLFQSSDQLETAKNIAMLRRESCILLRPSCDENSALAARMEKNPFPDGWKNIVVIGSLQVRKGQDLAIRAFETILEHEPSAQLHLVGGGGNKVFEQQLEDMVRSADLKSRVHFHGHRDDYLRWIAHCDLVMQPSLSEGVSRVLRETIFLKKAVVAFNIPGTREILGALHENLAQPYDVEELARKSTMLLGDESRSRELSDSHFQHYIEHNSWSVYRSATHSIFTV